jgi:hypothetical protein
MRRRVYVCFASNGGGGGEQLLTIRSKAESSKLNKARLAGTGAARRKGGEEPA